MAQSLDDGEFWLPPQFLSGDDSFLSFGGSGSSTETESDEEDLLARQMDRFRPFQGGSPISPPTLDLLYAAAGEVARMRMDNKNTNMGFAGQPAKPYPISAPVQNHLHRLQAAKYHVLKQQQEQRIMGCGGQVKGIGVQNRELSSGMRAMFLDGKRECGGTGVFLPLRKGVASETRKKPSCSVLVPARVAQALNLKLDDMGPQPKLLPRYNATRRSAQNEIPVRIQRQSYKENNNVHGHEIGLPQEWIY